MQREADHSRTETSGLRAHGEVYDVMADGFGDPQHGAPEAEARVEAGEEEESEAPFDVEAWDDDTPLDIAGLAPSEIPPHPTRVGPPPIEIYVRPRIVPEDERLGEIEERPAEVQVQPNESVEADSMSAEGSVEDVDSVVDGEHLPAELGEAEIDTSPVTSEEMTGIWLTTVEFHDSPVWLDGAPAEPEDLDVPPIIADRLRDWADMWNTQWDPETGWLPRARITDYEALGAWLGRRVKDVSGAVRVTVQLSHLGRSGIRVIDPPETRVPVPVRLMNEYGAAWPVWVPDDGEFVTEFGVGSFSSEINARLEVWAQDFERHMDPQAGWQAPELATRHVEEGRALARAMQEELGPDYQVNLDLWEIDPLP